MSTYLIGDLHGHLDLYQRLLQASGLCNAGLQWTGGNSIVWQIGDFFDRGPDGVGCVDLTMALQKQAADAGGSFNAILGNHEMMLLAAWRFADETYQGMPIRDIWKRWGGVHDDLSNLGEHHAQWLRELPAMVLHEGDLILHADAMLYVNHGITVDAVNASFRQLMESDQVEAWMNTLNAFGEHMAFSELNLTGTRRAEQMLKLYGANRLFHGHTPIPYARGDDPALVDTAWVYAGGRCINVDGGIYMGGPGFIHTVD